VARGELVPHLGLGFKPLALSIDLLPDWLVILPEWLVITADRPGVGRGVRGYSLAWFLRTYFGRRAVATQTPKEARDSPIAADTVFLGLPTTLAPDDAIGLVERTGCRRLVVYDYLDQHELAWTPEQEAALRPRITRYLKPWFEQAWDDGIPHGLLPVRLRGRLHTAVTLDRLARCVGYAPRPRYDVAFLGRPNRTRFYRDGAIHKLDQRVNWLTELRDDAPALARFGGFIDRSHPRWGPDVEAFHFPGDKINFFAFWRALRRSRVLLAPGGNVPWTYRHYECLYAGGVVVTIDYRCRDMLVPLPVELMVHAPDEGPVLPSVREALERREREPELPERVYVHLDQYLKRGGYSRSRPKLMERFLSQLD
jgi:hypothetical protein